MSTGDAAKTTTKAPAPEPPPPVNTSTLHERLAKLHLDGREAIEQVKGLPKEGDAGRTKAIEAASAALKDLADEFSAFAKDLPALEELKPAKK